MDANETSGRAADADRAVARMRRYLPAVIAGAVGGIPLGLWAGYLAGKPTWGPLEALFPLGITLVAAIGLLVAAGVRRSDRLLAAALGLVAAVWLGAMAAPDAPGSHQAVPGTGMVGTRDDPDSNWSGSVTCEWRQDWDVVIAEVRGFDAPDLLQEACRIDTISLAAFEGPTAFCSDDGALLLSRSAALELEGVSPDGRTGSAILVNGGWLTTAKPEAFIFTWACAGGP